MALRVSHWYEVRKGDKGSYDVVGSFDSPDDAFAYLDYVLSTRRGNRDRYYIWTHPDMPRKTFAEVIAERGIDEKAAIRNAQAARRRQLRAW